MATESEGGGGGGDDAGAKRRRQVDEQGDQSEEVAAGPDPAPVDRLSALPADLRRCILTLLPLKDAIRSGALAKGWRDFWKSRWEESTSCVDIHLLPGGKPTEVLRKLEDDKHPRLDRFSLVVDNQRLRNQHLKGLLAYAAEKRVEDLRIDLRGCKPGENFIFHLPLANPLLAHLSLRNINMSERYYYKDDSQPFCALEVIHLHSITSSVSGNRVLQLCPRLRILDMRRCSVDLASSGNRHIRSFRYSGGFSYYPSNLLEGAAPTDLYICLGDRIVPSWDRNRILPDDLSALTELTVCSNALKVVASSLLSDEPKSPNRRLNKNKLSKLPSLKELQLLMHGMEMHNLADIYLLLKSCDFSNLERLFVQLPATSGVPLRDSVEEMSVELPGDSLVKLGMVKVMNFNWRRFEVQLVSLLLMKATSLHKLLLVSPNVDPLHVPGVQEADLFLVKEALASGRVIVSEFDDPATQPFHPGVFIEE